MVPITHLICMTESVDINRLVSILFVNIQITAMHMISKYCCPQSQWKMSAIQTMPTAHISQKNIIHHTIYKHTSICIEKSHLVRFWNEIFGVGIIIT